jgi:hypothetical protein
MNVLILTANGREHALALTMPKVKSKKGHHDPKWFNEMSNSKIKKLSKR